MCHRVDRERACISIHALLAESDNTADQEARKRLISIHALLAESDGSTELTFPGFGIFLSTLSLRRATDTLTDDVSTGGISIHALLAESDRRGAVSVILII